MKFKLIGAILLVLICSTFSFAAKPVDPDPVQPNPVIVAKDGGHFTDPIAAMDSIFDASATNPYLIKIMPGIYDLGASPLYVKDFVSIEGSGIETTTIKGSVTSDSGLSVGLVVAGNDSRISSLYIENNESSYSSLAVRCSNVQNFTLEDVSIVSNGRYGSYGVEVSGIPVVYIKDSKIAAEEGIRVGQDAKLIAKNISLIINDKTSTSSTYGGVGLFNFRGEVLLDGFNIDGTLDPEKIQRGVLVQHVYQSGIYHGSTELKNGTINVNNGNSQSVGIGGSAVGTVPYEITNTKIISSGIGIGGGAVNVNNCIVEGSVNSVGEGAYVRMSQSQLIGPLNAHYSSKCFNNYDFDLLPVSCQ